MRMSTPYVGTEDHGILTMTQQEIHEAVEDAHRNGWQIGIHANGNVTIDMVLNAYERVLKQWPSPDRRHRLEHCTLVNPSLIAGSRQRARYRRHSGRTSTTTARNGASTATTR